MAQADPPREASKVKKMMAGCYSASAFAHLNGTWKIVPCKIAPWKIPTLP